MRSPRATSKLAAFAFLPFAAVLGCAAPKSARREVSLDAARTTTKRRSALERICVEGRHFVTCATRARFTPWGFNYDHDRNFRLLEQYWKAEWPTVVEDFEEMHALGANVVRVHLQLGAFMPTADGVDEASLDRFSALLDVAERVGIRLDVTGLGAYRSAETPAYYDALDERERWATQARFWRAVASRGRLSHAVFAYDLMNEPVVPETPPPSGKWVHDAAIDGLHFIQYIAKDRGGRAPPEIVRAWAHELTRAVRDGDPHALITIGMLPAYSGFRQTDVSSLLDFVSIHIYPVSDHEEDALGLLGTLDAGKPIVIEEFGAIACTVRELEHFLVTSRPLASGWLGFYWGKTPEELRRSTSLPDALLLGTLEMQQRIAPTQ